MEKDGRLFYKIRVSRGWEKGYLSTRWYPPEGWSRKAIERELHKQAAEFERRAQAGEVISREEQAKIDRQRAIAAAKIKTLKTVRRGGFHARKDRHHEREHPQRVPGGAQSLDIPGAGGAETAGDNPGRDKRFTVLHARVGKGAGHLR